MKKSLLQLNRMKLKSKLNHIAVLFRPNPGVKSGQSVVTVSHISREISRHCYFFLEEEGGGNNGNLFSATYRTSPVPSGGLEIPLVLWFQSPKYVTYCKMKRVVQTLYDYRYTVRRLILTMMNPRSKSVFQFKKETWTRRQRKN